MMVSHRKFPENVCALMPSPRPSPTGRGGRVPSPLRERGRVRGKPCAELTRSAHSPDVSPCASPLPASRR
ncbi:TPA: hypothetical protein I4D28_01955 [Enterobacter hormaechei]|nr:hypothetical protein EKN57_14925 [Enterobacter hormaechei]HAS1412246.1 hypothetical protein [Enterobacter hormaechei]